MATDNFILISQFCTFHQIDNSFLEELQNYGLIEIIVQNNERYLPFEQLSSVEKMVRLHYDLDINMEGIDAITNLLTRIDELQHELISAQNRLQQYQLIQTSDEIEM